MDAVESLPARPLSDAELALLNRADPVTLAVAVDDELAEAREESDDAADSAVVDDATDGAADDTTTEPSAETGESPETEPSGETGGSPETEPSAETGGSTDGADGLLVATASEVIGLALVDGEWAVVDRLDYGDGVKRYDALRSCESAVRRALGQSRV